MDATVEASVVVTEWLHAGRTIKSDCHCKFHDDRKYQPRRLSRRLCAEAMRHRHFHDGYLRGCRGGISGVRLPGGSGERPAGGLRLSGADPLRDRREGTRFVPARGGFPEHQQCRGRLRAARVWDLRRPGGKPSAGVPARCAHARGDDAAHGAERTERRPAGGDEAARRAFEPLHRDGGARPGPAARQSMAFRRTKST